MERRKIRNHLSISVRKKERNERKMKQSIVIMAIYTAQCLLGGFLIDLCLRRWTKKAGRIRAFWLIPYILFSLMPAVGALLVDSAAKNIIQAIGNIWLGFFLYFGALLLLLLAIMGILRRLIRMGAGWYGGILCLCIAAGLAVSGYGMYHAQQPKLVSYDLFLQKAAEDTEEMKVVLIADLHLGVNSRLATTERMVEMINGEEPDVVVIAGDIFTSSYEGLSHPEQFAKALRGIQSKYGVYAVYGNHDVEEPLLGGFALTPLTEAFRSDKMEAFFADCGFTTLADDAVLLPGDVQLFGRMDGEKAGDGTKNRLTPAELLAEIDPERPVLVLEHEPLDFQALAAAGADVILCGHTHAGQVFPGNLIVPYWNENPWGYARMYDADTIVTAGVGYYGSPMRVGTNSEVTVIHVHFA